MELLKENTAQRLAKIMLERNLKQVDILNLALPYTKIYNIKLTKSDLSQFVNGKTLPGQSKLTILSKALNVSEAWLMGFDVPMEKDVIGANCSNLKSPIITNDTVTLPVIGEIAAGYGHIALEDWSGESVEIPSRYLKGRSIKDFFVLTVHGESMYPLYLDGDKVLILKQSTLNRSGEVGAIIYDDEIATLKKIEYVAGEDWLKLIPLNPAVPPVKIEGEDLEHCRVIGVPNLLIRDIVQ